MTSTIRSEASIIGEVLRAEQARCRAVEASDWATVASYLSEDFTYTHATGRTEGRDERLAAGQQQKFSTEKRRNLKVRVYGDAAVVIGDLLRGTLSDKNGRPSEIQLSTIQVWVNQGGNWRLVAQQNSRAGAGVG